MRKKQSMLLCPTSQTYPVFDAFLCLEGKWWCLQITGNKTKDLSAKNLLKFYKAHPHIPREWFGIVRPEMAHRQKRFPISLQDKDKEVDLEEMQTLKNELVQFVIPFPIQDEVLSGFKDEDKLALVEMRINAFKHFSSRHGYIVAVRIYSLERVMISWMHAVKVRI
jgi:hypothetical protein